MTKISKGVILSQLPRMLGVYPVISDNPQLNKLSNTWKSYGSAKELQVQSRRKNVNLWLLINLNFSTHFLATEIWLGMLWLLIINMMVVVRM